MSATGGRKRKAEGSTADFVKPCIAVLKFVSGKNDAEPFLEPVDWEALGIPDYPTVIKTPMDLGTIQTNLEQGKYSDEDDFAKDVRLVWTNAKTYNQPGSGIYVAADNLSKAFERRFAKLKKSSVSTPKRKKSVGSGKPVSSDDKVRFSTLINNLEPPQIGKVVEMIQSRCPDALNEEDDDDLEIEVDKIDNATLLALNNYCNACLNGEKQ